MKTKFYPLKAALLVVCALFQQMLDAQVAGTLFRDMNSNGTQELSNPIEPGVYGVTPLR